MTRLVTRDSNDAGAVAAVVMVMVSTYLQFPREKDEWTQLNRLIDKSLMRKCVRVENQIKWDVGRRAHSLFNRISSIF